MNKTAYNNYHDFLPFINSKNINIKLTSLNQNLNSSEQNSSPNNSFKNNQIFFNDITNYKKFQLIKKINSFRNKKTKNDKFPSSFVENEGKRYLLNKNIDLNKINKDFSISINNKINKSPNKNKTFYLNQEHSSNLSLEKNINDTSKNTLILDLNHSDSFKKINSSYLFHNLLNKISSEPRKEIKIKAFKNTVYKLSSFYKKSKDKKISARQIYKHYLKEEENKTKNKRHQFNGSYDYSYVVCPRLKIIYGFEPSFINRLNEIKKNDNIAKKKDFNIKEYQTILMKLFEKNISEKYMEKLRNDYKSFNEKNLGVNLPKGRYINLANKLRGFLSDYAYENIKRMDKNYLKYYGSSKDNKSQEKNKIKSKNKAKNKNKKVDKKENENEEDLNDKNFWKKYNKIMIKRIQLKKYK